MLQNLGPPFAFSVWVASRLLLVHSSTVEHLINPAVNLFIDVLRDLGHNWKVADRKFSITRRFLEGIAANNIINQRLCGCVATRIGRVLRV